MKAMTIVTILLFVFLQCTAPELTSENKQDQIETMINNLNYDYAKAEYNRFVAHLRAKESPSWKTINKIGCIGWFQFSRATLSYLGHGYITPAKFKKDPGIFPPALQLQLLDSLIKKNEASLMPYMCYIGRTINGTNISRSGLIAGAHLGGARGVRLYLDSNGKTNRRDLFKTSIGDYIKEFEGYNIKYTRVQSLYRIKLNNNSITHIISDI